MISDKRLLRKLRQIISQDSLAPPRQMLTGRQSGNGPIKSRCTADWQAWQGFYRPTPDRLASLLTAGNCTSAVASGANQQISPPPPPSVVACQR